MDLYAIQRIVPAFGSTGSSTTSPPSQLIKSFHNEREEFARFLNMMLAKTGQMMNPPTLKSYDINYDSEDSEDMEVHRNTGGSSSSSTDFNTDLLLSPFNSQNRLANGAINGNNSGASVRATLADQFTWGAVVCAGVFIVVFVCVMAAWWVHKKQQDHIRRRTTSESVESRMGMDGGPYCIENDPQGRSHGATNGVAPIDIQRPPSYFEVIGFFDPPPSYNDIQGIGNGSSGQHSDIRQAYDNVAITIDELPPPFVEGDYLKSEVKSTDPSATSAITSSSSNTNLSSQQQSNGTVITQEQEGSTSSSSC